MHNYAELIERHQAMVFRTLARMTGQSDVEDLAQEVFLRLLRGLPAFRGGATITTFLYRIMINVVNDEWRRRERARASVSIDEHWQQRLASSEPGPGELLDRGRFLAALRDCVEELSGPERAAIILYFQEERTYEEIAAILGLPMGTVKTHLHRARRKLKEAMQERMRPCPTTL